MTTKLLLDTHIFLLYISADPRLPAEFRASIQNPANEIFLSVVSIWESTIKYSLGKLPLPGPPAEFLPQQRLSHKISSLALDEGAMVHYAALPLLHRDPFDRIMIAQALQHEMTLVTMDDLMKSYPVKVMAP